MTCVFDQYNKDNYFSPYPEDYSVRDVFKGVNIYTSIPNRYPYMYDRQPFPALYYNDRSRIIAPRITPKVFPYTNRPWTDNIVYHSPKVYNGLIDDRNLRPMYVFYKN